MQEQVDQLREALTNALVTLGDVWGYVPMSPTFERDVKDAIEMAEQALQRTDPN